MVKTVLKQASCFEALMSLDSNANNKGNLTKEELTKLFTKAQIMSNQLNERELHLLNNEKVMKTFNEFDIGKINSQGNKGVIEKLFNVINPNYEKGVYNKETNYSDTENYEKYVTGQYRGI